MRLLYRWGWLFVMVLVLGSGGMNVRAQEGLGILTVSPQDDTTGVQADPIQIAVAFDRPVVALTTERDTLPNPLDIEPALPGSGQWVTSALYVYSASQSAPPGLAFTVTIDGELTAVDGTRLAVPYQWTFHTANPQVLSISGSVFIVDRLLLNSPLVVTFNQPMDRTSTETAFEMVKQGATPQTIEGAFSWSDNDTVMRFQPADLLSYNATYIATVGTEALAAASQIALNRPASQSFFTVNSPDNVTALPRESQILQPGLQRITFRFPTQMVAESYRGQYVVEPEPAGGVTPFVNDNGNLTLEFNFPDEGTYQIRLLEGMQDIFGTHLSEPQVFRFEVRERETDTGTVIDSRPFFTVGGYTEPFAPIRWQGESSATFDLYRVSPDEFSQFLEQPQPFYSYHFDGIEQIYGSYLQYAADGRYVDVELTHPWVTPENHVNQWTLDLPETPDASDTDTEAASDANRMQLPLTQTDGTAIPLGLYGIEYSDSTFKKLNGNLLAYANASISVRNAANGSLIWVTDMVTAEPLAGVSVQVWRSGQPPISATTDADGIVQFPKNPNGGGFSLITAEADGIFGIYYSKSSGTSVEATSTYLYTDRPIYRAGEPVHFRAILRNRNDNLFSAPAADERVHIRLSVYRDQATPYFEQEMDVTPFGTVSGSLTLPADVPPGYYQLLIDNCNTAGCPRDSYWAEAQIVVGEFRVPEFAVTATAAQTEIVLGEPVNVQIEADYYSGGRLRDGSVQWAIFADYENYYRGFNYTGTERGFRFHTLYDGGIRPQTSETTFSLSAEGSYLIEEPFEAQISKTTFIRVEGTVIDASGQAISGSDSLVVHPANVYVGLRVPQTFTTVGQDTRIDVLAVTPQSAAVAGQVVDLEFVERRWERREVSFGEYQWFRNEIPVSTIRVQTGDDGMAVSTFQPSRAGVYYVLARTRDAEGREVSNLVSFYVSEASADADVWGDDLFTADVSCSSPYLSRSLALTADRGSYRPGETAQVFIRNPFSAPTTALISVEREGILSHEVVRIEGSTYTYSLPMTDHHVPNVRVSAMLVSGISDDQRDPEVIEGSINLIVEPTTRRLNVELTPTQSVLAPGDTLTIDVRVTDDEGNPVAAEVGLALTDEAALALRRESSTTLESHFYQRIYGRVVMSMSLMTLVGMDYGYGSAACGGGGGDEATQNILRDNFIYTPLWVSVTTDADGRAQATVTMPDNLTRWRLKARAITEDAHVGEAVTYVTSTKQLIVRPVAPRFFVAGDEVTLAGVVQNNTEVEQIVTVTLDGSGFEGDLAAQTVTVAAENQTRVAWNVTILDTTGVDMTVTAVSETGLSDSAKPALRTGEGGVIPVLRYTAQDTAATSGMMLDEDTITESIALPTTLPGASAELTLRLDSSLAGALFDSIEYLRTYPYEGIEQTISRFFPNIALLNAAAAAGVEPQPFADGLPDVLEDGLTKLTAAQNEDGGWGWFNDVESNPVVTAYALAGLKAAERGGFEVNADMITRAARYLRSQLFTPEANTPPRKLHEMAFMLYALGGTGTRDERDTLFDNRLELSHVARAWLLMAYLEAEPTDEAIPTLVSDLTSAAILSATGTHWEEAETNRWLWDSNTRTTAVVIAAILRAQPEHPILPGAVRWLMTARRGDTWLSTQETAWALIALGEWMGHTDELHGNYAYRADLDGETVLSGQVTGDVLHEETTLPLVSSENAVPLTIERGSGDGALYYAASLNIDQPAATVEATSRGITVQREYFDAATEMPIESVGVGDLITIRLTVIAPHDVYFFVLEDHSPAGAEIVDPSLRTSSQTTPRPGIIRQDEPFWNWGWFYFDNIDLLDQGARLYADYLPKGIYLFSYQVRATTPGVFNTLPAQGFATYDPDIYGRTAGQVFRIEAAR